MKVYVAHQTPAGPVLQAQDDNVSFVRFVDSKGNYIDMRIDGDDWVVAPGFRDPRVSTEFCITDPSPNVRIRK